MLMVIAWTEMENAPKTKDALKVCRDQILEIVFVKMDIIWMEDHAN